MKIIFVAHLCESRDLYQSSAYNEIVEPVIASGRVSDFRVIGLQDKRENIENSLQQRISEIKSAVNNSEVAVYGAGDHTCKHIDLLRNLNVRCLFDRDRRLWGTKVCNYDVFSPERIGEIGIPVVISSKAWEDAICSELRSRFPGLSLYRLYAREKKIDERQKQLKRVIDLVSTFQPDVVFYSAAQTADAFSPKEINEMRKMGRFKLVTFWWDYDEISGEKSYLEFESNSLMYSDLIVDAGNISKTKRLKSRIPPYHQHPNVERVIVGPTLTNPKIFFRDDDEEKIYDVAIFGGSFGRRGDWILKLRKRYGERFHHFGGVCSRGKFLEMEEYGRKIRQTKIFVNTQTYPSREQLKGKVREALSCSTFLLEEENVDTRLFIPDEVGLSYFSDEQELFQKIDFYLENEDERIRSEKRTSSWYMRNFDYASWFDRVMSHL